MCNKQVTKNGVNVKSHVVIFNTTLSNKQQPLLEATTFPTLLHETCLAILCSISKDYAHRLLETCSH